MRGRQPVIRHSTAFEEPLILNRLFMIKVPPLLFILAGVLIIQSSPGGALPAAEPKSEAAVSQFMPTETPRDIPISRMKASASSIRMVNGKPHMYVQPQKAVDLDPERGWCSDLSAMKLKTPTWFQVELDAPYMIDAVRYFLHGSNIPKRPELSRYGRITGFNVCVSEDGVHFRKHASGTWDGNNLAEQRFAFARVATRWLRLEITSVAAASNAAISELALEGPKPPEPTGTPATPPKDAARQVAEFAKRNSPEMLRLVTRELNGFLNLDAPILSEYKASVEAKNDEAALRAFNRALLKQIQAVRPVFSSDRHAPSSSVRSRELMECVFTKNDGSKYKLGSPGAIGWLPPTPEEANMFMVDIAPFYALLGKYRETGDRKYLNRWAEIVDDWSMYAPGMTNRTTFNLRSDAESQTFVWANEFCTELLALEDTHPGSIEQIPAATLARYFLKSVPSMISIGMSYYHANAQNWTIHGAPGVFALGVVFDPLIRQDLDMRSRALRSFETYASRSCMEDGTEAEQALWYNWGFYDEGVYLYRLLNELPQTKGLVDATWLAELRNNLLVRLRRNVSMYTQAGDWPLFMRGDDRRGFGLSSLQPLTPSAPLQTYEVSLPEFLSDPLVASMLNRLGTDGAKAGPAPQLRSGYYPWGGIRILREGWDANDCYASMFSSPQPGKYGARCQTENNSVGFHAFGQDIIVDDAHGHYGGFPSPVVVDGKSESYRSGYPSWGHKQWLINAWEQPDASRFLAGDAFDYAEGTYSGTWGGADNGSPNLAPQQHAKAITDARHHRGVLFVRPARMWIVTDRFTGARDHTWTTRWLLPCAEKALGPKTFSWLTSEIEFAPDGQSITTSKPNGINLSMHFFAGSQLKLQHKEVKGPLPWNNYSEASLTAKAKDTSTTTAIIPRPPGDATPAQITPRSGKGIEGFSATLAGGVKVECLRSPGGPQLLPLGAVTATAELLVMTTTPQKTCIFLLGAKSLMIQGRQVRLENPDVSLSLANGRISQTGVFSPIELVSISPACNRFAGQEKVSLSCPTPGVEIRYTLDGSEPSAASTKYAGPLMLKATTVVRARAFRIGANINPLAPDFTLASPASYARYEAADWREPVSARTTTQGLAAAYYEDSWQRLYISTEGKVPAAIGTARELFDIALRKNTGPFTFVYSGYLNIPADGLYTFTAPKEFMDNKIDAGYDLVMKIAGEQWLPAVRRHAFGKWSVALKKGLHPIRLKYLDYRGNSFDLLQFDGKANRIEIDYSSKKDRPNVPGMLGNWVWGGGTPTLLVSGPGLPEQPVPAAWLAHDAR